VSAAGAESHPSVLLVDFNPSFGGVERHVCDLAGELVRRGYRVGCAYAAPGGLGERLPPGVARFETPALRPILRLVAALGAAVCSFRPDVVHLHGPRAALLGRPAVAWWRARARVRPGATGAGRGPVPAPGGLRPAIVTTAHGWMPGRLRLRRLFAAAYRLTTPLDDATIAVSRDTAGKFGRWARRLTVVPNGLAPPPLAPPAAAVPGAPGPPSGGRPAPRPSVAFRPVRLGFVGRLTPEKGFLMAVAAFAEARRLAGAKAEIELHVYGDGPLLEVFRRGVARRRLSGVHFYGWARPEDVPQILAGLDALLLTSREEGLPYVLLEAMAAGCPVVATAVGGIPEVIEDGRTGFLVAPGDVAAGAQAVLALAREPERAARMREAARRRATDYPLSAMLDGTCRAYAEALERRRRHV
jgi:glycosyltransferase involved in cell wall biosynthesis